MRKTMIKFVLFIVVIVWSLLRCSSIVEAQEKDTASKLQLVDLLIDKFGKPTGREEWKSTTIDYKLGDGRIFTINISKSKILWSGIKTELQDHVDRVIALQGTYRGPGKYSSELETLDGQSIDLAIDRIQKVSVPSGLKYGDRIIASGILRYKKGRIVSSENYDVSDLPDRYYFEKTILRFDNSAEEIERQLRESVESVSNSR